MIKVFLLRGLKFDVDHDKELRITFMDFEMDLMLTMERAEDLDMNCYLILSIKYGRCHVVLEKV